MQKHVFFFYFKICLSIKKIINIKQLIEFIFAPYEFKYHWNAPEDISLKAINIHDANLKSDSCIITSSHGIFPLWSSIH